MLDRLTAPPFLKAKTFSLPDFRQSVLSNGIHLFSIPGVQQQVVKIEILFPAGRWVEEYSGVSHFASQLIEKGTQSRSAIQLAEAFDKLGAHIEIAPGFDNVSVSLFALSKNWKEAFSLMKEMITEPSFQQEELDLMKEIFIQSLKINQEKTSYVAGQLIRKNIFGEGHPYGSSIEEDDVARIEKSHLESFFKQHFQPVAAFITAHPTVTDAEVGEVLSTVTGSKGTASVLPRNSQGAKFQNQEKEGSVQKSLRIGKRAITRAHPDYFDLALFNHILGGYFGSRLMKNIREEKGLTYGIYSSLNPLRMDSFLLIGADVNKTNTELALKEIKSEIEILKNSEVSSDELETAKSHFLGSLQLEVANPFSVMEKIKNIYLHNLPPDYYQKLFSRIGLITGEDLMATGKKYFAEDDLFTVTVG